METRNYKRSKNIVYACRYRIIWCPKYRRKVLVDGIDFRLKELILDVCKEISVNVVEIAITPDCVELLVEAEPQISVHSIVKRIKGQTSRTLCEEFSRIRSQLPTLWSNSYMVTTVGKDAARDDVKGYENSLKRNQRAKDKMG